MLNTPCWCFYREGFKVILKVNFFFSKNMLCYTNLLCPMVLYRATLILFFSGPPPALLPLDQCPQLQAACYEGTGAVHSRDPFNVSIRHIEQWLGPTPCSLLIGHWL